MLTADFINSSDLDTLTPLVARVMGLCEDGVLTALVPFMGGYRVFSLLDPRDLRAARRWAEAEPRGMEFDLWTSNDDSCSQVCRDGEIIDEVIVPHDNTDSGKDHAEALALTRAVLLGELEREGAK